MIVQSSSEVGGLESREGVVCPVAWLVMRQLFSAGGMVVLEGRVQLNRLRAELLEACLGLVE